MNAGDQESLDCLRAFLAEGQALELAIRVLLSSGVPMLSAVKAVGAVDLGEATQLVISQLSADEEEDFWALQDAFWECLKSDPEAAVIGHREVQFSTREESCLRVPKKG